jgi:flagellar FliJ protein
MPQIQALNTLAQREQQARDQAVAALRHAEDSAQRARDQATQLMSYRSDYEARWAAQFNRRGTMEIVQCYRSFMQRLDQAVQQQSRVADAAEAQAGQARAALLDHERRLASVRKLIERRATERVHAGRRQEQKHNDELAQRMRWRAAQHSGPVPLS